MPKVKAREQLKEKIKAKDIINRNQKLPEVKSKDDNNPHIPRNVNDYSHFLQHAYITEKDIEWILKLRNDSDAQELSAKLARIPNQAFSVAERKTTVSETRHNVADFNYNGNAASVMHLLRHRACPLTQKGQLQFETGLREYGSSDKNLREKEKKWTNLPLKDKKEFPEFLPKYQEEIQTKKQMKESGKHVKMTYSGFDGAHNFPNYTMKFKQKNVQDIRHLFGAGQKMSTILWEEGLREQKSTKKQIEKSKSENEDILQSKKK